MQGCAEGKLITMHWNYNEIDIAACGGKPFCVIYEVEDSILCFFAFLLFYGCKLRAFWIQDFRKKQEKRATLFVMHLQALLLLVCDMSCSCECLYILFPRCREFISKPSPHTYLNKRMRKYLFFIKKEIYIIRKLCNTYVFLYVQILYELLSMQYSIIISFRIYISLWI